MFLVTHSDAYPPQLLVHTAPPMLSVATPCNSAASRMCSCGWCSLQATLRYSVGLTMFSVAQTVCRRMLRDCAAGSSAEGNCSDAGVLARHFLGEFEENHDKLGVSSCRGGESNGSLERYRCAKLNYTRYVDIWNSRISLADIRCPCNVSM